MTALEPRGRLSGRTALGLLSAALLLAVVLAVGVGSVPIAPLHSIQALLGALGLPVGAVPETEKVILFTLRLPRVVAACLVGAALATAGCLLQGLLRNPLADPYVIGTSGGAALGAALGMLLEIRYPLPGIVPAAAFAGALGATGLVLRLASRGGRLPVVSGLLTGFVVSTLLAYTVSLLLMLSERLQLHLPRVYGWLLGSVAVAGWGEVLLMGLLVVGGAALALPLARTLNALSLGEEAAAALGVEVERDKWRVLSLAAVLTAAAVSVSGLIGFVGLVIPHMVRLVVGPDHRALLPCCTAAGALALVIADLVARTVLAPGEIPVGIVTAFLGAPIFLWLLRREETGSP